jgi:hypothetical protein
VLLPVGVVAGCELACAKGQPSTVSFLKWAAVALRTYELKRFQPPRKTRPELCQGPEPHSASPDPAEFLRFFVAWGGTF